ncbi:PIN domain-containing protein [Moorella sulfitireducens]|uniref:PIN domain-containing protein n=1 Tax=Neomoorella sulfitireducens TaxID=2972948 RepID=UPI0021AC647B|nr:PIN domain-containing protein [Moorella sulfitireducens]
MPGKAKTIDANIILRFLLNDNPERAERCSALLQRVESGAEQVFLPDLVIADVVWTLEKFYRQPKARIKELLLPLLSLRGMRLSSKSVARKALEWYVEKNVDWTDAFIAASMVAGNRIEIYSYDRHFDKFPEIKRIEP